MGWIPIRKSPKFRVVDTILLEQLFTLCGCWGISPLLCLAMQLVLVSKYPVFKINTAIIRLVITIACTATKMTTGTSKHRKVTSSWKVTNH